MSRIMNTLSEGVIVYILFRVRILLRAFSFYIEKEGDRSS